MRKESAALTGDEVSRVGGKGCVPDPALMALQDLLELKLEVLCGPDIDRLVCRAGCEMSERQRGPFRKVLVARDSSGRATHLTSGERSTRVMHLEWALNLVTGMTLSGPSTKRQT